MVFIRPSWALKGLIRPSKALEGLMRLDGRRDGEGVGP
jgi:hypothetical protein